MLFTVFCFKKNIPPSVIFVFEKAFELPHHGIPNTIGMLFSFEITEMSPLSIEMSRITSYNVCYTKLLRKMKYKLSKICSYAMGIFRYVPLFTMKNS